MNLKTAVCAPAGLVVNVDSTEGSQVVAANQRYTECLTHAGSSDRYSSGCSQTPVVLQKHKEVQSGSSSNQSVACQATGFDIHDSYAVLNKDHGDDAEEQLGSVLPSGAVVSAGAWLCVQQPHAACCEMTAAAAPSHWQQPFCPFASGSRCCLRCRQVTLCAFAPCCAGHSSAGNQSASLSASFMRSTTQQFRPSSVSSMRSSSIAGWGDSRTTYSRPVSGRGSDRGKCGR
jgi:hypothetical protein